MQEVKLFYKVFTLWSRRVGQHFLRFLQKTRQRKRERQSRIVSYFFPFFFLSSGNWSRLQSSFSFVRRSGYFLIHIYAPCALIVILSWISFCIPPDATAARIALGITSVLTITTILNMLNTAMPKVTNTIFVKLVCKCSIETDKQINTKADSHKSSVRILLSLRYYFGHYCPRLRLNRSMDKHPDRYSFSRLGVKLYLL